MALKRSENRPIKNKTPRTQFALEEFFIMQILYHISDKSGGYSPLAPTALSESDAWPLVDEGMLPPPVSTDFIRD